MSTVKYHSICDRCGKESAEYTAYAWCKECGKDVCPTCVDEKSYDPETCIAICRECAKDVPQTADAAEQTVTLNELVTEERRHG